MINTYYSNRIPDSETSLMDYRDYPYIDAILCHNGWFFYDFEDDINYNVQFADDGTYLMRSIYCGSEEEEEGRTFSWKYDEEKNLFTFDGVQFEPVYIDKKIIVFKQYGTGRLMSQPDQEYFHLINVRNPIDFWDCKSDIEDYVSGVVAEKEEKVFDKVYVDPYEDLRNILSVSGNKTPDGRDINWGTEEEQNIMHHKIEVIRSVLEDILSKDNIEALSDISCVSVVDWPYKFGASEMLHIVDEIYSLEGKILNKIQKSWNKR